MLAVGAASAQGKLKVETFYLTSGSDYTTLSISGFEQNFDTILGLVMRKVNHPKVGKYTIDIMVENMKADRKGSRNDADTWANALLEYAIDGDSSTNINRLTIDELREFHHKYIEGRPRITVITGNAEKFDLEELSRFGKLRELKFEDIFGER